ncbi:hypothetical protein [Nitrosomonas sp.]|uniref:hypothetical protein n=1 Tax=Nitrosomonas sp. TaxID=42353 RepID=UPI0025F52800|nr:hypothetical protein [Nitrosomonas sp.]
MCINNPGTQIVSSSSITVNALQANQSSTDRNNWSLPSGKFFIMTLLAITLFAASATHAATLLFKSNFGPGVSIGAPYNYYPTGNGAWQQIIGTDQETGHKWPINALGAIFSGIQLITVDPITPATIGNYITNQIRPVTGPKGTVVNELFQNVKIKGPVGQAGSQAPLLINRLSKSGEVADLYISYWFKYSADLVSKLDSGVSSGNWRTQFAFKTGGYAGNEDQGDYRINITILKGIDGNLYWLTKGDNLANGPFPGVTYWREENHTVPVPLDKWFKFEVYWHRSSGSDGRFWAAIDGEILVDYHGSNMGKYNLPITRIMLNDAYSGGYPTVESRSTGLEIWNNFPCGIGVSCHNFDTVAPSTPISLTGKLTKFTTSASAALSWKASSDAVGVAGYAIYKNGKKIGVSTTTSYTDIISSAATGVLYAYTIKAFDAAENLSGPSSVFSIIY